MSKSVIELVADDLETVLRAMTTTAGYRNNYANVSRVLKELAQVTAFPEVVLVLGSGSLNSLNQDKSLFSESLRVHVVAYVAASQLTTKDASTNALFEAGESVLHDLKKCLTAATISNINSTTLRSLIAGGDNMFRLIRLYADNATKGIVSVEFDMMVRYNQPSTF